MCQVLNFIVLVITTSKGPNEADIKSIELHISLLRGICSKFMVGRYTILGQCALFTQIVHVPNTFKVLQGCFLLLGRSIATKCKDWLKLSICFDLRTCKLRACIRTIGGATTPWPTRSLRARECTLLVSVIFWQLPHLEGNFSYCSRRNRL